MSDVVLVFPKTGFDLPGISVDIPVSLLAASNLVSIHYSVKIIDQRMDPDWENTLEIECRLDPLLVGITTMTGPQILWAGKAAAIVRGIDPAIPIVWGGVHPTLLPRQTLESGLADVVVIGEAEESFFKLVDAIARDWPLGAVKGIAFMKNGNYYKTPLADPIDLDKLPMLPYDLVDVPSYIGSQGKYQDKNTRSLIYFSSRGCPYRCSYCCNTALFRSSWRSMSSGTVLKQVYELFGKYGLDAINFHDEELFVDKKRIETISDGIGGRFHWWAQSRMDRIGAMDLTRLFGGGLRALQPGIESGSDRILRLINKGETVRDMIYTNRKLAKTAILPLYNFMMGFPSETFAELMESVDLAIELLNDNPNAEITGFYSYIPYPGTELYSMSEKMGFSGPDTLEGWAAFNRQHQANPWADKDLLQSIMVMSKFIDGSRMLRRLRDNSGVHPIVISLLRQIGRLYRRRWENHEFDKKLELKLTNFISEKLFSYR
jgi:anaerobic magnesium-protoporphyrin IX monomethyl ester cyclase